MNRFLVFIAIMALAACARQSSPTGGDKDVTPPQPLSFEPALFQTNFEGNAFTIVFDEYIQVKDLSSQLIISPPLKKQPEYKIRGKSLQISWEDTLLANTTYQFNFGKSVVDLNEGNVNPELKFVFSTGSYIDSLFVYGKVINAEDNEPISEAAVMIYTAFDDSLPSTTTPDYFALTDGEGKFQLEYLPEDTFKIFVLSEENNNYLYDGPPEKIAFLEDNIMSSNNDSTAALKFVGFIENDTSQYIASSKGTDYGRYNVVFNVPTENATIRFIKTDTDQQLDAISFLNSKKDSLYNWVSLPKDELTEEVTVITTDGEFVDTTFWYIEPDAKYREKAELKVSSNTTRSKLNLSHAFTLRMNNPLVEADTSLIYFLEDSVQVFPTDFERSNLNRTFLVRYPYKADASYIFKADPGAFKDYFGSYNDSISIPFSMQEADFYGDLTIDVTLSEQVMGLSETKILQLYTAKNKLLQEIPFTESLSHEFKQLEPGKYIFKVVFDTNGNGEWDTGDYLDGIQPERISIYPEEIQIRSNWDLELEWEPSVPMAND